jgi:aspartyl-tRNA(Asn)/glutamyl-tRNA(Gln) amidotransferase subunit B
MKYQTVIGMEIHAEMSTLSKVFCGCPTTFGTPPNSQICPICIGMPGVLPVLNRTALEYAVRAALALHCRINEVTTFDRKNYYYPDLPKNFQISQNYQQLGVDGYIEIATKNGKKRIGIINVHLEEDAGKLLHPEGSREEYSLVDLNRSGLPLLEIVSAPDMNSTEEAQAFMTTLKNLLQYIEVSDCKMQEGSLRFEINISLRPMGSDKLGTRVEIKNLNSMKIVLKAIEYEVFRQSQVLDEGGTIVQETRLWDDIEGVTRAMRTKEFAQDYRYFPEPDLVEVRISKEWQEEIRGNIPELHDAKKERFIRKYEIPEYDALILTSSKALADYYEECLRVHNSPKAVSNWIMTEVLRELNEREIEPDEFSVTPKHLACLIRMIEDGTISGKIAKSVFAEMLETAKMPDDIVKEKGLLQISDAQEIETIVDRIIAENADAVEQVRKGKDRAIGFLVGQVMKATRGKANPQIVNDLLKKKIL